jgi:hypothetical protein
MAGHLIGARFGLAHPVPCHEAPFHFFLASPEKLYVFRVQLPA